RRSWAERDPEWIRARRQNGGSGGLVRPSGLVRDFGTALAVKGVGLVTHGRTVTAPDHPLRPGERLRADEQLHRDRGCPAPPGAPCGVRRGGVLEGPSHTARLRGGPGRSGP